MTRSAITRLVGASIVGIAALMAGQASVVAADPPDSVIELPAGVACADFDLRVEIRGGNQVMKEFTDENGNVVRTLSAGRGSALTFVNVDTNASLALSPNGSVSHVTIHPDGSSTWTTTGHNVLILFPGDIPAGPSTTLHVGRVVFTVDTNEVFTVTEVRGRTTDLCAALSD